MQLADILRKAYENKSFVEVSLTNGRQFKALIKAFWGEVIVFGEVPGREFYEVFVPIQHIVSVEIRI